MSRVSHLLFEPFKISIWIVRIVAQGKHKALADNLYVFGRESRMERHVCEDVPRAVEVCARTAQGERRVIVVSTVAYDRCKTSDFGSHALARITRASFLRGFQHEALNASVLRCDVARAATYEKPCCDRLAASTLFNDDLQAVHVKFCDERGLLFYDAMRFCGLVRLLILRRSGSLRARAHAARGKQKAEKDKKPSELNSVLFYLVSVANNHSKILLLYLEWWAVWLACPVRSFSVR